VSGASSESPASSAGEAARLVQEVQNLGFEAARTIVVRFAELFAQFAAGSLGTATGATSGFSAPNKNAQTLQSDVQRAADSYFALLCQLNEAGLKFLDATRWWSPPAAAPDDLTMPDVAPGGRVSAQLWLHNTTAAAAVGLRPWCPGLVSHSGASLPAAAVTCMPERIDRLDADDSRKVVVTLAVGEDAVPGAYHGQLLVDGLPDVVFALRATVVAAADRP
jgi:hypothetical protein